MAVAERGVSTPVEAHREASRRFLVQAFAELEAGDLPQASEKGWGAASQMVKAAAEDRGWPHNGHRQLFLAIDRLVAETGDGDIRSAFNDASALHTNFYEAWLSRESIEANLSSIAGLMDKLEGLAA